MNPIVEVYCYLVSKRLKSIDAVPSILQSAVKSQIESLSVKEVNPD